MATGLGIAWLHPTTEIERSRWWSTLACLAGSVRATFRGRHRRRLAGATGGFVMVRSGLVVALGLTLTACSGGTANNAADNAAANTPAAADNATTGNAAASAPAGGPLDVWVGKH